MDLENIPITQYRKMLDVTRKFARNELAADSYLYFIDKFLLDIYKNDEKWSVLVRKAWDIIEVAHAYQLDEGADRMRADHAFLVRTAIDNLETLFLSKIENYDE